MSIYMLLIDLYHHSWSEGARKAKTINFFNSIFTLMKICKCNLSLQAKPFGQGKLIIFTFLSVHIATKRVVAGELVNSFCTKKSFLYSFFFFPADTKPFSSTKLYCLPSQTSLFILYPKKNKRKGLLVPTKCLKKMVVTRNPNLFIRSLPVTVS